MKYAHVLVYLLLVASAAYAQSSDERMRIIGRSMFCEAHLVPGTGSAYDVLVFTRIPSALLSFTKNESSGTFTFTAAYSVTIECTDSLGVIRCSSSALDSVTTDSYDQTRSMTPSVISTRICALPPSTYNVNVLIEQNGYTVHRWNSPLLNISSSRKRIVMTVPMVCDRMDASSSMPSRYGGSSRFSDQDVVLASVISGVADDEQWTWSLSHMPPFHPLFPDSVPSMSGTCTVAVGRTFGTSIANTTDELSIIRDESSSALALVSAPVRTSSLHPGTYRFVMRCAATSDSVVLVFRCIWPSMPSTLSSLPTTLTAMRYIMSDEEFERVSDADEPQAWRILHAWWKKFDPRTSTPFNQAMNAFFARADEAMARYKSAIEPNGIATARARVYILYGQPDSIQSQRRGADTQQETWTYTARLQRRIVFDIDDRGVYRISGEGDK